MSRTRHLPLLLALAIGSAASTSACGKSPAATDEATTDSKGADADDGAPAQPQQANQPDPELELQKKLDAEYPLHGLVTGTQLKVREKPDPESTVEGWLRVGSRVRLKPEPTKTATCSSGWYALYPQGYACAGEGVDVAQTPPESLTALNPPAKDAPLPYRYYFVKELKVPEWHRLPSRNEQRAAGSFLQRYFELKEKNEAKAEKFLSGELVEPKVPGTKVVRRYMDRGFFVAGAGLEERASRMFVRTVRGSYIKLSQLEERTGSAFHGEALDDEHTLPVAWAVRAARPFSVKQKPDGSFKFSAKEDEPALERHTVLPWVGRERVGTHVLHKLADGRYLKHWFAAVAERIDRPEGVPPNSPWVHVNLDQQTLVLYEGDRPVYATLVSSGIEGHETPVGLFDIRQKYVANTMSDLGPEASDDRYSIEDVPWTQYFDGSIALHGAFWHERFGLRRSHGCVNLAPLDAHRVFDHTWPEVAPGWHGVSTDMTGLPASKVYVTAE